MKKAAITIVAILLFIGSFAQNNGVVISTDTSATADPSAILDVQSTNKGVLIPRMTIEQRRGMDQPAQGLMVYQTDDVQGFYYYDGQNWKILAQGLIKNGHYLYPADISDSLGIGTKTPQAKLDVNGTIKGSSVVISTDTSATADPSAILDLQSTNKGVLIPRMTIEQRRGIDQPAQGLMVYQTDDVQGFYYYNGSHWQIVAQGIVKRGNYLYPADVSDSLGIGTTAPQAKLDVNGTIKGSSIVISTDTSATADPSAILDVQSTNKGMLIPRMTTTERDAITNPTIGLLIFNTNRKCIEFYTGIEWTSSDAPGTIKPFAGDTAKIPDGWLLCDGSELDTNTYHDLFSKIGYNWGGTGSTFKLPDLRGQFLRGADLGSGNDPDFATRTGGSTNEKIGSYQNCAIQSGNGFFDFRDQCWGFSSDGHENNASHFVPVTDDMVGDRLASNNYLSKETRPKNVYVNYIIKY